MQSGIQAPKVPCVRSSKTFFFYEAHLDHFAEIPSASKQGYKLGDSTYGERQSSSISDEVAQSEPKVRCSIPCIVAIVEFRLCILITNKESRTLNLFFQFQFWSITWALKPQSVHSIMLLYLLLRSNMSVK